MRYLIISFILLLMSVYLGIEISRAHSYVLFTYNHWVVETSLWVALCALLMLFVLLYLVLRLMARSLGLSQQYRHWRRLRHYRKARLLTRRGLCELTEGYWNKAEETLLKSARLTKNPLIDYLGAAKAAQAQHAFDRRDNYLRRAHTTNKESAIAIGLTQAQLQIEAQQWEQALSTLQSLNQVEPRHGHILKLLAEVYIELQEWSKCERLLPQLKKSKSLRSKEYTQLEHQVYRALLPQVASKEPMTLTSFWESMPRPLRHQPELLKAYVLGLLQHQRDQTAIQTMQSFLKHHWDNRIVMLYAQARPKEANKQLDQAEHWLKSHPQDANLLLTLGVLCLRQKLWGKAKEYLTKSIELKPTHATYMALAELYLELKETEAAQNCFKKMIQHDHHGLIS